MKKIEAVVRRDCVDDIRQSLLRLGIANMTLLEAKAMRKVQGPAYMYRGVGFRYDYLLQVKMEVFVADHVAQAAVAVVSNAARAGGAGSGSIFVSDVEEALGTRVEEIEEPTQSSG